MRKKLKYQGGFTKRVCSIIANKNRRGFMEHLEQLKLLPQKKTLLDFDVISFSGGSGLEDQILSIFSFLYYGGKPNRWTVFSDGSITSSQAKQLESLFNFVSVRNWDEYKMYTEVKEVNDYLAHFPLAKKLNIILGYPHQRQTIYIDSDIIFYKNFSAYLQSGLLEKGFWYAPDPIGDVNVYFSKPQPSIYSLNSGFLIINKNFDVDDIFTYLRSLNGSYGYFSEQSGFEYAYRKQNASILDPRQFVIDTVDQFDFSYAYHPEDIAMRHYTGPVRHKMWQKNWRWHFV